MPSKKIERPKKQIEDSDDEIERAKRKIKDRLKKRETKPHGSIKHCPGNRQVDKL